MGTFRPIIFIKKRTHSKAKTHPNAPTFKAKGAQKTHPGALLEKLPYFCRCTWKEESFPPITPFQRRIIIIYKYTIRGCWEIIEILLKDNHRVTSKSFNCLWDLHLKNAPIINVNRTPPHPFLNIWVR